MYGRSRDSHLSTSTSTGSEGESSCFASDQQLIIVPKRLHNSSKKLPKKSTNVVILLTLAVVAIVVYEGISYYNTNVHLKKLEDHVDKLRSQINDLSKPSPSSNHAQISPKGVKNAKKEPYVAITLCGDGDKIVKSVNEHPYKEWREKVHSGSIKYNKNTGRIKIQVAGVYFVYAQMFIYKNDGVNSNVLDFQIKKGYDVIAFASTPKETCLPSCTLYTSRIIELKIGDLLSITSHYKGTLKLNSSKKINELMIEIIDFANENQPIITQYGNQERHTSFSDNSSTNNNGNGNNVASNIYRGVGITFKEKQERFSFTKRSTLFIAIVVVLGYSIWQVVEVTRIKIATNHLETQLESTANKLKDQKENRQSKHKIPTINLVVQQPETKVEKKNLIAINLCGRGHQYAQSYKDEAFTQWDEQKVLRRGDINYDEGNGHLIIKQSGIYYVYAQMFFYENQHTPAKKLEFFIKRDYDIIAVASVPKSSCLTYCTKYVSRTVTLYENNSIYVTSDDDGVKFRMSCDKALFGMYMLKKI